MLTSLIRLDKTLRWLVITPDMHRIHHSSESTRKGQQFWLFGVLVGQVVRDLHCRTPKEPQTTMTIGLTAYRLPTELGLTRLLLMPFKAQAKRQG